MTGPQPGDRAGRVEPTGLVRRTVPPPEGDDDPSGVVVPPGSTGRDERLGAVGSRRDLLDTLAVRTARLTARLRAVGGPDEATSLEGWSRLHVACHLRFGAEASLRLTLAALHGEATSWYPTGRPRQRPRTLRPRPGEDAGAVLRSLDDTSAALHRVWEGLRPVDWQRPVRAARAEDPRHLTVDALLVLRLTEVEVHGTDLDVGLPPWSAGLVTAALPLRLARLDGRWPAVDLERSWLLDVRSGPTWVVHVRNAVATAAPVAGDPPPVDASLTGEPREILALLLGRPVWDRLELGGDAAVARAFAEVFPGP